MLVGMVLVALVVVVVVLAVVLLVRDPVGDPVVVVVLKQTENNPSGSGNQCLVSGKKVSIPNAI